MPPASPSSRRVRFGVFEVNFAAQELRKHGTRIRLRGQPFALLQLLVEKRGEVVTREEMKARLWPSDTFVDFENSLNTAVKKLRSALGDSPENARYVETIPRAGYRFVAPVQDIADKLADSPVRNLTNPVAAENIADVKSPNSLRLLAVSAFVAILAGALWLALRTSPKPRVLHGSPLTTSSRIDTYGRIQTDGVRLFFLERHGNRWELMQMPASGGEVRPFDGPFQNTKVFAVSPDASQMLVAPFPSREDSLPIWLMPSVGGTPNKLGEVVASDAVFTIDGKQITYSNSNGIFQTSLDGLNSRSLVDRVGPKAGLSWSPDGKRLRFSLVNEEKGGSAIWEVGSDGKNLHQLLPDWEASPGQCCGRWTPDGRYYVFLAYNHDGRRGIWALRETHSIFSPHEAPAPLDAGPLAPNEPLPGRDGHHLFVLGGDMRGEDIRYDLKTRETRSLLGGVPGNWVTPSPDGAWLVFHRGSLWRSAPDGSDLRALVPPTLQPEMPAVSPDGKNVVFHATPQGAIVSKIYEVSAAGGTPHELVSEKFSVDAPAWLPDGKQISYALASEAGQDAGLYIFDLNTRAKQKIPGSESMWKCRWSPDGRYIAGAMEDQKSIKLYDRTTQKWSVLAEGKVFSPVAWSRDSQYLYFQDLLEDQEPMRRVRVKDGNNERLDVCKAFLEGDVQRCGFVDLMPDGSLVLNLRRGDHNVYSLELDLP